MSLDLAIAVLLVLGLAFMALEAIVPSFGLMGLLGAGAFFGALAMLRNAGSLYGMPVDVPVLTGIGVIGLAILLASIVFAFRARKKRVSAGVEMMPGMAGRVIAWSGAEGRVHVDGEVWAARGPDELKADDIVIVMARDNLTLTVAKGV